MTEAATVAENKQDNVLAYVSGKAVLTLPKDLYIPPDAMEVLLEIFSGPLDLLLYLIRKHDLDILDIPVAQVTAQYIKYIEIMQQMRFELAAEYLEMAAMLTEIKSRMLLPRPKAEEAEEIDPRAELVRRLQEYEKIKIAADKLDELPRMDRDVFSSNVDISEVEVVKAEPYAKMDDLISAFKEILLRVDLTEKHSVSMEVMSVRERMTKILSMLEDDNFVIFAKFFDVSEGRLGVVVTFLAILEMVKERFIEIVQAEAFKPIYLRRATATC